MQLELASKDFLNLREVGGVGPWLDVLTYRIRGAGTDQDLLQNMITSRWYDYSYAEPRRSHPSTRSGIHGPYDLAKITPEVFVATDGDHARAKILAWSEIPPESPTDFSDRFNDLLRVAFHGTCTVYELPDMRECAEHSWGAVVGSTGFLEFVSISEARDFLTLVVASDD